MIDVIDVQAQRFAGAQRRELVLGSHLNGIDYVELDPARTDMLHVHFLKPVPIEAYGLPQHPERVTVVGGMPPKSLRVVRVARVGRRPARPEEPHLLVTLERKGDLSLYTLQIATPELDPCFGQAQFSWLTDQAAIADCRPPAPRAPATAPEPLLDYMAKDYASFRQVLLDLVPQLNPQWTERSPADLGIALVELIAYAGDRLSYLQDAIANEAYLDRVRLRISARRLARLLDYRMHDGRNAWTWVYFNVEAAGEVPLGTRLITRIEAPLAGDAAPPGPVIADLESTKISAGALLMDPALKDAVAFETASGQVLDPLNNEIRVHDFGTPGSWLAAGVTAAFLYSVRPDGRATRPRLQKGDWLLLEEAASATGSPPDPNHRQVVMIDADPVPLEDAVFSEALAGGRLQLRTCPGAEGTGPLPLMMVSWRAQDAVREPFLLSPPADAVEGCPDPAASAPALKTVARGNLVAADHGLHTTELIAREDPVLQFGPLTHQCLMPDLGCEAGQVVPAITLAAAGEIWTPVFDLLESSPFDRRFVAELDEDGLAHIRFGDGVHGREAPEGAVWATYRVGNGAAGNVGADALTHIVVSDPTQPWLQGVSISNPLPARGGTDPEGVEQVRARAPEAATSQLRAITEADYREAALSVPGVVQATASLRWTGSWTTAFVGVQPAARGQAAPLPSPELLADVTAKLERWRLAGVDVVVRPPRYVGLDVALTIGIAPGHFRNEVLEAVDDALMALFLQPEAPRDGGGGPVAPVAGAISFGTPVFLSSINAAAAGVDGVDHVTPTRFRPFGEPDNGELAAGVIRLGRFDIATLANDPHHPELGVLRLSADGGKG